MNWLIEFFGSAEYWSGDDGIPIRLLQHLEYSFLAFAIAALIALPLGLLIGHTGRGAVLVVVSANAAARCPRWACSCWSCCSSGWVRSGRC